METRILLTGFEPFGGERINPSWLAVRAAAAELTRCGIAAEAVQLPCVFDESARALQAAVDEHRPSLVVCVGQAGGRSRVSLERVAINVQDARIPDNAGHAPVDRPVLTGGPDAYFSTLPVKACLAALTQAGLPAEVSNTAGTYVCNSAFYTLMQLLSRPGYGGVRGGFVHIPWVPEQAPDPSAPVMDSTTAAAALVTIVRTALATATDVRLPAGALH